jgi:hypothetical protein
MTAIIQIDEIAANHAGERADNRGEQTDGDITHELRLAETAGGIMRRRSSRRRGIHGLTLQSAIRAAAHRMFAKDSPMAQIPRPYA